MQHLNELGYCQTQLTLPDNIKNSLEREDWAQLDLDLGRFYRSDLKEYLNSYTIVNEIEYLISVREAPDENGIWHDDGSRKLAFTLSLMTSLEGLIGGVLNFRKKGNPEFLQIPTPPYGVLTIFKTGVDSYEHQITKVEKGKRVISAGWIT